MAIPTFVIIYLLLPLFFFNLSAADVQSGTGTATFYGGDDASGTMGGACGYGNLYDQGYGTNTAAPSTPILNNGLICGACFKLQCINNNKWCFPGTSVIVTATNACPPGSEGGWCDPPKINFDLAMPAFKQIAQPIAGVIDIKFERVPCVKTGGIRFTINGNPWWNLFTITNVGCAGNIEAASIMVGNTGVMQKMKQSWGANWESDTYMVGQNFTIQVTASDGQTVTSYNVGHSDWKFGDTLEGGQFKC